MNARTTLVVVGLFLLVLGYVYFVELPKTPAQLAGQTPRPAPHVFDLPSGQVQTLELRDLRNSREIRLTRSGSNAWQFERPTTREANFSRVDPVVMGFAQLQTSRVFTDVAELSQYGVLSGTLEARMILRDSTPYAITVGNKTADGNSYYAIYTGGKQYLFIIASTLVDEFLSWFDNPPYPPTPTPTPTALPPTTPTPAQTPTTATPPTSSASPTP